MFTGLIERQGVVLENKACVSGRQLCIRSDFQDLQSGESISVNGVCLTLKPDHAHGLFFDVSPETLACTTLGTLRPGESVNLERAMAANGRFGGHYVSAHVDSVVTIDAIKTIDNYTELTIGPFKKRELVYLIPKGSVTLDGVSLTINQSDNHRIKIMLVPYTLSHTNLQNKKKGDLVNVEFDYVARAVAHQVQLIQTDNKDNTIPLNQETQEV